MLIHTQSEVNIVTAEITLLCYKTNLSLPTVPSICYSGSALSILEYEMEFLQIDFTIYIASDNLIRFSLLFNYAQW